MQTSKIEFKLVEHIREWHDNLPEECRNFISLQITHSFPGIPYSMQANNLDALSLIIRKFELDGLHLNLGYVASFMGCIDFILYQYADIDRYLDDLDYDKEKETKLLLSGFIDSADEIRQRIDNAACALRERKKTVDSWTILKEQYLNHDYLKMYSGYLLQESIKNMNTDLFDELLKKGSNNL